MATIKETALDLLKFAQKFDSEIDDATLKVTVGVIMEHNHVYLNVYKGDKISASFHENSIQGVKDEINRWFNYEPETLNNIEL